MKRIFSPQLFLIVVFMLTLTSCATNRGVVRLDVPAPTMETPLNGKTVIINSVTDNRQFQENPKTQDIPSLGFGGAAGSSADIKKRSIGRKRNSFGKALGDILLEEGQTVETVITSALKRSFSEKGYKILEGQNQTDNTIVVDASIEKFWAYMTPGFWAITLSSDISTDIQTKSVMHIGHIQYNSDCHIL
jgi:uncharacterized lipoprotein YajG